MNSLGKILTFYSYKGGVGRSMGLANVAALLAKWRRRVLVVDWDLEAPGIEAYFKDCKDLSEQRQQTPGVIDLIHRLAEGEQVDWHDCLLSVPLTDKNGFELAEDLKIISAGKTDGQYMSRVQNTNWAELFSSKFLGLHLETLRNTWKEEFDFILIDSRTGITDIGGVCTIQLPDSLLIWFISNQTSVEGVKDVAENATRSQAELPFARNQLAVVPVPSRDESRTEVEKARAWHLRFAEMFGEFYKEWVPLGTNPLDVINDLRIPYVAFWSFGETLPVAEEDSTGISDAYELLSRLLFFNLRWEKIREDPEQSVEYLIRVVDLAPSRFAPVLADKLFQQALYVWKEDRDDEAIELTREAITTWEKLAETNTDLKLYGPDLAKAKKFLSDRLKQTDERDSIYQATAAIELYRKLYKLDSEFQDEAATALVELSNSLHNAEEKVEASIAVLTEAIEIYRRLAESNPRRFEPELARALYDLSNWFFEGEQFSQGLVIIQQAVPIFRRLKDTDQERFEPDLADSLITLSECSLETGDMKGALAAGLEAVEIYKSLEQENPKRFESGLVKSYDALLDILSRGVPRALATVQEAVGFFKNLRQLDQTVRYEANLAKSLNLLSEYLLQEEMLDEALTAQQEAIDIFRRLTLTNTAQYEPELALSLINLSKLFVKKNDITKAQATAQESVEILERLSMDSPTRYKEDLEDAIGLANRQS